MNGGYRGLTLYDGQIVLIVAGVASETVPVRVYQHWQFVNLENLISRMALGEKIQLIELFRLRREDSNYAYLMSVIELLIGH